MKKPKVMSKRTPTKASAKKKKPIKVAAKKKMGGRMGGRSLRRV